MENRFHITFYKVTLTSFGHFISSTFITPQVMWQYKIHCNVYLSNYFRFCFIFPLQNFVAFNNMLFKGNTIDKSVTDFHRKDWINL